MLKSFHICYIMRYQSGLATFTQNKLTCLYVALTYLFRVIAPDLCFKHG